MSYDKSLQWFLSQEDTAINISLTIVGLIGLLIFIFSRNLGISIFVSILLFPTCKIITKIFVNKYKKVELTGNQKIISELSDNQKNILDIFYETGEDFIRKDEYPIFEENKDDYRLLQVKGV